MTVHAARQAGVRAGSPVVLHCSCIASIPSCKLTRSSMPSGYGCHSMWRGSPIVRNNIGSWRASVYRASMPVFRTAVKSPSRYLIHRSVSHNLYRCQIASRCVADSLQYKHAANTTNNITNLRRYDKPSCHAFWYRLPDTGWLSRASKLALAVARVAGRWYTNGCTRRIAPKSGYPPLFLLFSSERSAACVRCDPTADRGAAHRAVGRASTRRTGARPSSRMRRTAPHTCRGSAR